MSELSERRPRTREWSRAEFIPVPCVSASAWRAGEIYVLSTLIHADLPRGGGQGLQWHMSISRSGKRPKPHQVRRVLRAFGMEEAENDNHHPGVAQNYFMVVDPAGRVGCECKVEEETIVESDGFRWTNPREGECRGCEYQATYGRPCPIHLEEKSSHDRT